MFPAFVTNTMAEWTQQLRGTGWNLCVIFSTTVQTRPPFRTSYFLSPSWSTSLCLATEVTNKHVTSGKTHTRTHMRTYTVIAREVWHIPEEIDKYPFNCK